jgi:hypothetical protein
MQKRLFGTILMASTLLACSGDENQQQTSGNGVCDADELCFDVVRVQPGMTIEAGRIVIVWWQFNESQNTPRPLVGYDVAVDPAVTKIEIPIADIALPTPELLYCKRACDDAAMCPCISEPQLGYGIVGVGGDADGDGELDTGYSDFNTLIIYSQKEHLPGSEGLEENINAIAKGVRGYVRGDNGLLQPTAPGTWRPLYICPSGQPACTPDEDSVRRRSAMPPASCSSGSTGCHPGGARRA